MNVRALFLVAALALLAGCSDEKPLVAPKALEGSIPPASQDIRHQPAADSAETKNEPPLDLGNTSAGKGTEGMPSVPTKHDEDTTPNVEFGDKASPEPAKPPTPGPSPINWVPSQAKPEQIASAADKAMGGLKDTLANIPILAAYGDLKGMIRCQLKLRDSNKYWIQYAQFENGGPHQVCEYSDGVKKTRIGITADSRRSWPAGHKDELPGSDKLADAWLIDMPKMVLSQWVSGTPIFSNLVQSLKHSGFVVQVDKLRMVRPEHTYVQDRLTFTRNASKSNPDGDARTMIVFDHDRGLPVTIEIATKPAKQVPVHMFWRAEWRHSTFSDKVFAGINGTS